MKFDAVMIIDCWTPEYGVKRAFMSGNINNADNMKQMHQFYDNFTNILNDVESSTVFIDTTDYGLNAVTDHRVFEFASKISDYHDYTDIDISIEELFEKHALPEKGNVLFLGGCFYSGMNNKPLGMNAWYSKGYNIYLHRNGTKKTGPDITFVPRSRFADIDLDMYNNNPEHEWVNVEGNFWHFNKNKDNK